MNELRKFYTKSLLWGVSVALLIAFSHPTVIKPTIDQWWVADSLGHKAATYATSQPALLFLLGIWGYVSRYWLWKVFHPNLNVGGHWYGRSMYTTVELGTGHAGQSNYHTAIITQDCLAIKLTPTHDQFNFFRSLAVDLDETGRLCYAYEVSYLDASRNPVDGFPPEATGVEWLTVERAGRRGRPTALSGHFAHCARGQSPVYSGDVWFQREPFPGPPASIPAAAAVSNDPAQQGVITT